VGIGPLPAARFHQALTGQPGQQRVQDRLLQAMPGNPAAELAQHTEIETLII
jgi:hypothetical protein